MQINESFWYNLEKKKNQKHFRSAWASVVNLLLLSREINCDFIEINGYQSLSITFFSRILTWKSLNTHAFTDTVSVVRAFKSFFLNQANKVFVVLSKHLFFFLLSTFPNFFFPSRLKQIDFFFLFSFVVHKSFNPIFIASFHPFFPGRKFSK